MEERSQICWTAGFHPPWRTDTNIRTNFAIREKHQEFMEDVRDTSKQTYCYDTIELHGEL
jgi:hypothetical protein